jgi:hypothetical protein
MLRQNFRSLPLAAVLCALVAGTGLAAAEHHHRHSTQAKATEGNISPSQGAAQAKEAAKTSAHPGTTHTTSGQTKANQKKTKKAGSTKQANQASLPTSKQQEAQTHSSANQNSGAPAKGKHGSKHEKEAAAVPAPPPAQPPGILSPIALQQIPATPAQVEYKDGRLTILARNSTLGDILISVRKQTGADIDFPPNTTERVVGEFGPGPARDVLATLLDGSSFNYVLLGSASNPNELERVILTHGSKAVADSRTGLSSPTRQGFGGRQVPIQISPSQMSSDEDGDGMGGDESGSDETGNQGIADQQGQAVKTPEQLLQELQRQQQTILQQQPQGSSQPGGVQPNVPVLPPDTVQGRKDRD